MTTIRSRVPVLIDLLMAKHIAIKFDFELEPIIFWTNRETNESGHVHLYDWMPGVHGANAILIQRHLLGILTRNDYDPTLQREWRNFTDEQLKDIPKCLEWFKGKGYTKKQIKELQDYMEQYVKTL